MSGGYTNARLLAKLDLLGRPSARPWNWDAEKRDIEPFAIYNHYPAIPVDARAKVTMETRRQSEALFMILEKRLGRRKRDAKRTYFQKLFHAAKRAVHENGCVRISRDTGTQKRIHIQVIDAAVEQGYFLERRSPPGSEKASRLIPLHPIERHVARDPWEFDPNQLRQFVFLRRRKTESELPIDWTAPIASETQERLELINAVNARFKITYEPLNYWELDFVDVRRLRPVHYAVFIDDWNFCGRLHTGKYGHQSLRKIERRTLHFDQEPCVEIDYGGMHPRLLYHLEDIPFDGDPYALWGNWKKFGDLWRPMRLMAKQLINAAINAATETGAVSACNQAMNTRTERGYIKTGAALIDSRRLLDAARATGLKFKEIYSLAKDFHEPIAKYFGSDYGMTLMRIDSSIAIDVLHHFAKLGCPCLSVHDSFIVPVSQVDELERVMLRFYKLRMGFSPELKVSLPR